MTLSTIAPVSKYDAVAGKGLNYHKCYFSVLPGKRIEVTGRKLIKILNIKMAGGWETGHCCFVTDFSFSQRL